MNGDPTKPKYTLEQDLDLLLDRNFDSQRIVEIMQSNGYDPNDVVNTINTRYETQRKEQLAQQEERDRIRKEQQEIFEGTLKKKDVSEPDGEPSRFGLDSIGQKAEDRSPDATFYDQPKLPETQLDQPQRIEAVANPNTAQVSLLTTQAEEAYFNEKNALSLAQEVQDFQTQDPVKINRLLRSFQSQGLLTQFNVKKEINGRSEAYMPETLAKISQALQEVKDESSSQMASVMQRANKVNEEYGSDLRYRVDSNIDRDLFMATSIDRTIAEREKLEQEVKDEIERVGKKAYYGTIGLGGAIADDLKESLKGTAIAVEMFLLETAQNPIKKKYYKELAEEARERRKESDERKSKITQRLANSVGVSEEIFNMGITDRVKALSNGNISSDDFWTASTAQTARLMVDAFRTAAEFMIGKGVPLATDVFANSYADTRINNPHMSPSEVSLHAAPKAAVEIAFARYLTKAGKGATGALKDLRKSLIRKESLKQSGKKLVNKNKNVFKEYLIPEGIEEGLVDLTNQSIDMLGDLAAGRNVRDLNLTQAADAFLGGFAGAAGPAGLSRMASNIGHSRNMKDKLRTLEVLKEVKNLHDQETNPEIKALYRERLVKAMAEHEMVSREEAALYATLNPEEQSKVLGLNQELYRIKEIISKDKYWTGEAVTKEDKAVLEKRYEALYESKKQIEDAAVKRAEKEAEEPVMAEDSNNEEVATEPQEQDKKEADKRKETPVAPKAAPEEQIQEEKALSEFDETKDPEVKEETRRGDKQVKRHFKTLEESETPEAKMSAIQSLLDNVANGVVLTAEEQALLDKATSDLEAEGYTFGLKIGDTLTSGTNAKSELTTTKLDDKTLSEAEDAGATKNVIIKISKPQINKEGKLEQAGKVRVEIQELSDTEIDSKIRVLKKKITALKKLGQDTSLEESDIAKLEAYKKARAKKGDTKAKETAKEPESKETFDIEVDGATNLIGDTENVGDGKGQMSLRVAQAIDNLTKGFKKKGVVKKIKFYKNPKDIGNYSAAAAKEIADGYTVKAFYDPSTGTIVLTSESKVEEVKEEFGHAHLVDIIGKDAASRIKLYKELKAKSKKSKDIKKILEDVEDTYKSEVTNENAVESLKKKGKDSPTAKEISSEKAKLEEEIQKTVEEESIIKILRESKKFLKEGFLNKIIRMINTMFKNRGGKGNIITGHEDLSKLARKFEMATKGVETEVKVDEAEADPLVRKKGESLADFNTRLEEIATEKLKFEETEESKKQQEFEESAKSLDFSKKKEFTYLKDTELYYTDVVSRTNQFTGVSTVRSVKEKSVNVNDYFHYRNLWAKLTGNGQETSRMEDVYFITKDADGNEKIHKVKPPKPKTDREGNVLNIPTQKTFNEQRIENHFEQEKLDAEFRTKRASLDKEVTDLWMNSSKRINLFTDFQDFFPQREETEGMEPESMESKLENFVIAKKNLLALIASDVSSDNLRDLKGNKDKINPNVNPEIFNMSGISKFGESEVDTEVQDIQDTDREINPDATSSIKFSKEKASKKYRKTVLDNTDSVINVSSYLGKATDLIKKPFKEIAKDFKEGKVFNVAWDQVAAVNFKFKGNSTLYNLRSGIEEVTTSDFGKSVSFRSKNYRKQFMNKVQNLSGKIHVSISLNDANEMIANPALFESIVNNIFYQADQGVIDKDTVLKQASLGWNARKSDKKDSAFEAAFKTENSSEFEPLIVKKSDGVYEWKDYESLKKGHELFLKADKTTLGHFKRIGLALIRDNFVAEAQIEGDPVLPTISDIREQLILPEYLDEQGQSVESGTMAAVMTIDLDKMRSISGGFQTKMDQGSSFPYAMNGGLESIVMVEDKPATKDVYRIATKKDASMMQKLKAATATPAKVALGFKGVTSKLEDLNFSKTKDIDTEGSTEIFETDQGPFELRTMSAYQRLRNRFLQKFANNYQYIFNIQEDIVKSKDGRLKESQDFEMAETRMYGKSANDLELLKDKVKDITADIKQKGLNIEEVELYLYAQHAKERNAVILERSNGKDVSGSGITDARADEILNSMDKAKKAKIEEVAKKIREIQQNTRDTMVEFGLESQETIDVLENLFKNYVPLGGLAQDEKDSFSSSYPTGGAGMHVYGSTFKKASGRKSEAPNILAQIISQNASVHIKGRTNEALQSLYELVEQNPNKNVWSIVNKPNDVDPHTIAVRVDGKQRYIRFVDASYAETLRGLNAPATSMFGNMMAKPARWLRASFTTLSPEFMISNFSRDIQSALFNAAAESDIEGGRLDGEQVVQDMIKMVPSTLKALLKPKVGMEADPLMQRYYDEYKADGGKTGWAYTQKISDIAKDLEKESKDKSKMQELLGAPKNLANFVEGINDAFENSIRLAAYVAAREKGISRGKAAQFSKNVTVNFNRHGEWGQALNGVYMFFNASVQGSMVLGRSLATLKPATKPDGSKRAGLERVNNAQKLAFGLFLFSGLVTMMNRAMSDEDEDGVIFYDKIPDYIKERNMIIMNPRNGKDYYKIPLPYGYSLFSSLGSTVVDVAEGGKDWDEALMFLSSSTINAFSPVSFGQSKDLFNHVGKSATPTVLKPIVDVMTNETYFGSPVYAAQSPYGVPKSESAMAFRSPKAVQDFFEWINDATGGSEYKSGWADMNPDKPWYMFEYAIGGAGKFVKRSGGLAVKLAAKAKDNDFKIAANDVPFLRILYGEASKYYDSGKYNEAKIDITQLSKEYKEDRKLGDPSRYKGVLILKDRLDKYERQLKVLRKKEREARKIENFTERSIRIQELRDKKNKIFMQFNRAYENIRKNE